ncbi:hypothetical protein GQ53DRAFT_670112 [Thozetella sp. PMI_491]|nr:hypothetical protein GQ53DRAFT_670112 [Thozetella sp. PMI_491]
MLISNFQLCLAHYCDLHGPTPLMVTEGLPVPCGACYDDDSFAADRPRTSTATSGTPAITEALRRMNLTTAQRSSSVPASEIDAQTHRAALLRSSTMAGPVSAIETPPQSPRLQQPASGQPQLKPRPESGFRKTYDDYVTRRAAACDNCALTLPRRQEDGTTVGIDSRRDRGPTLRTRAPCARVYGSHDDDASPSVSQTSSSTPSDDEGPSHLRPSHRRTGTTVSTASRSSTSSVAAHVHYLDYTSTHEPIAPNSFSIVRASCLRTLSFETTPRPTAASTSGSTGSTGSTPIASPSTPGFVTMQSPGSTSSGGPLFFGDPMAGYTTAYIFRIPDMHARGHKRVYAFLALSTHRERLAMKSFGFIANAFHEMAAWIQTLAEAEAERAMSDSAQNSPIVAGPGYGSFGSHPESGPAAGSSFLTGGMGGLSRRLGGGFGSSGPTVKQRGLPELVGLPDFFIQLHTRFVRLLLELGVVLNS